MPAVGLPNYVDQFMLEQLVCEEMNGFLLIVNTSGKIIFVSHTVENLLGHLQVSMNLFIQNHQENVKFESLGFILFHHYYRGN